MPLCWRSRPYFYSNSKCYVVCKCRRGMQTWCTTLAVSDHMSVVRQTNSVTFLAPWASKVYRLASVWMTLTVDFPLVVRWRKDSWLMPRIYRRLYTLGTERGEKVPVWMELASLVVNGSRWSASTGGAGGGRAASKQGRRHIERCCKRQCYTMLICELGYHTLLVLYECETWSLT